jgi:hypothetical protein
MAILVGAYETKHFDEVSREYPYRVGLSQTDVVDKEKNAEKDEGKIRRDPCVNKPNLPFMQVPPINGTVKSSAGSKWTGLDDSGTIVIEDRHESRLGFTLTLMIDDSQR